MLDLHNTEETKEFIYKLLVENRELKDQLETERLNCNFWYERWNELTFKKEENENV